MQSFVLPHSSITVFANCVDEPLGPVVLISRSKEGYMYWGNQ